MLYYLLKILYLRQVFILCAREDEPQKLVRHGFLSKPWAGLASPKSTDSPSFIRRVLIQSKHHAAERGAAVGVLFLSSGPRPQTVLQYSTVQYSMVPYVPYTYLPTLPSCMCTEGMYSTVWYEVYMYGTVASDPTDTQDKTSDSEAPSRPGNGGDGCSAAPVSTVSPIDLRNRDTVTVHRPAALCLSPSGRSSIVCFHSTPTM